MKIGAVAFLIVFASAVASPLRAQADPAAGDLHVQSVDYDPARTVILRTAPGYQLMVELAPDEQVRNVAIGDSGAWQVSVSREGNRLFLKPSASGETTNMTVVTSIRTYLFDLEALAGPSADMPYTVAFHYPPQKPSADDAQYVDVSAATRRLTKYRISGAPEIRPSSVSDDGAHTYISWPRSALIPAVYAVDRSGNEVLLNGMMGTDDVYVVDGAPLELEFKLDRAVARAERVFPRRNR